MTGDDTTYHEWRSVAGGLGRRVLFKLRRQQHVSYYSIPWEWLLQCVIVYFVVSMSKSRLS